MICSIFRKYYLNFSNYLDFENKEMNSKYELISESIEKNLDITAIMKNSEIIKNMKIMEIYEIYMKIMLQKQIQVSNNDLLKKRPVHWFLSIAELLADCMMKANKEKNLLSDQETVAFLCNPLLSEIGIQYDKQKRLIDNENYHDILNILFLNVKIKSTQKNNEIEENIEISFSNDTLRSFLLAKNFKKRIVKGECFPDWIFNRLIIEDVNLIKFLVEVTKENSKLKEISEIAILATKKLKEEKYSTRAANLISILVASNHSFFGKDLSYIKIKGANISDGIFNGCNFDYADLSQVNLNNVKIDEASFYKTNLDRIILDNYTACIGHSNSVNSVAFSPDGKKVVSGSDDNTLRIWDAETGQR